MFLRELQIEALGALESAQVRFDVGTALIGENDAGVASLLDALELVLVPRADGALRFGERTRVRLVFEERRAGDWSEPAHAPLRRLLRGSSTSARNKLVLEATPQTRGRELALRVEGAPDARESRELVAHVLRTSPLIRVRGGLLSAPAEKLDARKRAGVAPEVAALVERIVSAADELLAGRAVDPERTLAAGADAARALLARSPRHFAEVGAELTASVVELLGEESASRAAPRPTRDARGGPAAELFGVLLVVAALLRRMPRGLEPGVEPIWILEDPEAHLHPIALASVGRVLEGVRWQKIVATNSGELLSAMPLSRIRRLVRHAGRQRAFTLRPNALSRDDLRRIGYHLRVHRGVAMFARAWLLVEGESEYWILPQVARVLGHDLALEGVCCVSFAQCGIEPLIRAAHELGIEWHLLADGDDAGERYVAAARKLLGKSRERERITLLGERDIEHFFWRHGHSEAIARAAGLPEGARIHSPSRVIAKAVERHSKPHLALRLVEAVAERGARGVPAALAQLVQTCVELARRAPQRALEEPAAKRRSPSART